MSLPHFDRPVAHRGYHDRGRGIIENSRAAFDAAIDRGFGIECDLQLSADGAVIVFHDDHMARLTGLDAAINDTASDVIRATPLLGSAQGQCPQTFAEFLEQVDGRVPLVVELKSQRARNMEIAEKAARMVAGYAGPLVFKSFDPDILRFLKAAGHMGPLGIITYHYRNPESEGKITDGQRFILRNLLHYPQTRFSFISCEQTSLNLPAVRFFRSIGVKVMSWTIKSKDQAALALEQADQIVFEGFDPDP